jgi:hypothetical protein
MSGEPPLKRSRIDVSGGGLVTRGASEAEVSNLQHQDAPDVPAPIFSPNQIALPRPTDRRGSILGTNSDPSQWRLVNLCLLTLCSQGKEEGGSAAAESPGLGNGIMRRSSFHNFMPSLEQHFREQLTVLFMHDRRFAQSTQFLNFAECKDLTDEELTGIPFLSNLTTLNIRCVSRSLLPNARRRREIPDL